MRGVVFLVQRLVADHRPARGLDHLDVEPVLRVEAHRLRHDDRRRAGDRDEADLEVLLLDRPALREHFGRGLRAGRTATSAASAVEAPTLFRKRGARRPAGRSRASPPRRPRPRSASVRFLALDRRALQLRAARSRAPAGCDGGRRRSPTGSADGWDRTDGQIDIDALLLADARGAEQVCNGCASRAGCGAGAKIDVKSA